MKRQGLVLFGCLLGSALAPVAAQAGDPAKTAVTPAQVKLGHFVSSDGMHGFVLDRSTATAKLQVDGEKAIIELTMEEDRQGGRLAGYLFRAPDGTRKIYISVNGGLTYYKGNDEHRVSFDKDAKALGAPTVKGKYVPETPAYEKIGKELDAISVRKKMPAMTANDASNLAKVTEAFNGATAPMFVRYKAAADGSGAYWSIAAQDGAGYGRNDNVTDEAETKRHKALAKHGAVIYGYSSPDTPMGNHMVVDRSGETPKLASGTPGLIWEIDGTSAVFVTVDGGRYSVSLSRGSDTTPPFDKGVTADTVYPTKVFDTFLDYSSVSALAKVGALPKTAVENLEKIDGEWTTCTAKGWEKLVKQADNNPKMTMGQAKAGIAKLHKGCNKAMDKYEKELVKLIEERTKARAALLATATAKAKAAK